MHYTAILKLGTVLLCIRICSISFMMILMTLLMSDFYMNREVLRLKPYMR